MASLLPSLHRLSLWVRRVSEAELAEMPSTDDSSRGSGAGRLWWSVESSAGNDGQLAGADLDALSREAPPRRSSEAAALLSHTTAVGAPYAFLRSSLEAAPGRSKSGMPSP